MRDILVPGDMLEGCRMYPNQAFSLSHPGIHSQVEHLLVELPQKKGLRWRYITGNHDDSARKTCGVIAGEVISAMAREHGRRDLQFLGETEAYCHVGGRRSGEGVLVKMHHPRGSSGVRALRNHIDNLHPKRRPAILLQGHYHQYRAERRHGVICYQPGGFQGATGLFREIGLDPDVGGLIIKLQVDKHWRILRHAAEFVAYPVHR